MQRPAGRIEGVCLEPAEIGRKASCPHDRGDAGIGQVQCEERIGHACRKWVERARIWFDREVESVAGDVGISGIEQREVVRVATGNVALEVGRNVHHAIRERSGPADERHPARSKTTEVHGVSAVRAADRNGDMFHARFGRRRIPHPQNPEPPTEVLAAVSQRRSIMRADREVHALSRAQNFIGDLRAR